jgi:hypothetical protein
VDPTADTHPPALETIRRMAASGKLCTYTSLRPVSFEVNVNHWPSGENCAWSSENADFRIGSGVGAPIMASRHTSLDVSGLFVAKTKYLPSNDQSLPVHTTATDSGTLLNCRAASFDTDKLARNVDTDEATPPVPGTATTDPTSCADWGSKRWGHHRIPGDPEQVFGTVALARDVGGLGFRIEQASRVARAVERREIHAGLGSLREVEERAAVRQELRPSMEAQWTTLGFRARPYRPERHADRQRREESDE